MLIIKDVIQHWSHAEVVKFIEKTLPKFRYALITNCFGKKNPRDIVIGDFRRIDLTLEPYNLKMELVLQYATKRVYLWTNPEI